MKYIVTVSMLSALLSGVGTAQASNELLLLSGDSVFNEAVVEIAGNGNRLAIVQEWIGGAGANRLDVNIEGNLNGGPLGEAFRGAALGVGLAPGSLLQQGSNNAMHVDVSGTGNLFGFAQVGSTNSLSASIVGQENQAAVLQVGNYNVASFSQNGLGNSITIVQKSW